MTKHDYKHDYKNTRGQITKKLKIKKAMPILLLAIISTGVYLWQHSYKNTNLHNQAKTQTKTNQTVKFDMQISG